VIFLCEQGGKRKVKQKGNHNATFWHGMYAKTFNENVRLHKELNKLRMQKNDYERKENKKKVYKDEMN
jgi:hypothetical protein